MTAIVEFDSSVAETLHSALGDCVVVDSIDAVRRHISGNVGEDTIVVGPSVDQSAALALAEELRLQRPSLGLLLVRRRVDTSLLTEAIRAGVREVVLERDVAGLTAAVKRSKEISRAQREQVPLGESPETEGRRGRLITVFSAKGGCGKTTLSTNLAAALADRGRAEVVLVDLDLSFGDVSIALQQYPAHTLADAVPLADTLDESALKALLTPHSPGLTTLVAPVEPSKSDEISGALVARVLEMLKDIFDFVVVDTPPAFDDQVLAAFDASDMIALIATLDIPALKNLKLTLETMDLLNYPRERCQIVLNRADSKVGLSINEVEKTLGTGITAQIPSSRDVPASINRGVPIVLDDPKHPVSIAIKEFADFTGGGTSIEQSIPADLRSDRRSFLRRRTKP
jgi:pilus assembly protein CpaE